MADSTFCHACSSTEQRFLEASMAYQAGKSIVSDEEYDQLKRELRMKNSMVIQQVHIHPTMIDSITLECRFLVHSRHWKRGVPA